MIGLPEVLEREVQGQLYEGAAEAAGKIRTGQMVLRALDTGHSVSSFDEGGLRQRVAARLEELERLMLRVPFTLEHARAALERVMAGSPPNSRHNQQFKDSAIWEALFDIGSEYDVYFVTADKGFFTSRDPTRGLAEELSHDIRERERTIEVIYAKDQDAILQRLGVETTVVPRERVLTAVEASLRERIELEAAEHGFAPGIPENEQLTAYVTPTPSILAVSFLFKQPVADGELVDKGPMGTILVSGQCTYDTDLDQVGNIELSLLIADIAGQYDVWESKMRKLEGVAKIVEIPLG